RRLHTRSKRDWSSDVCSSDLLSGGMLQRAMIAMALSCDADLLIADEPTTALDVTIQLQLLNLIQRLNSELDMGIILITHDLGVRSEERRVGKECRSWRWWETY